MFPLRSYGLCSPRWAWHRTVNGAEQGVWGWGAPESPPQAHPSLSCTRRLPAFSAQHSPAQPFPPESTPQAACFGNSTLSAHQVAWASEIWESSTSHSHLQNRPKSACASSACSSPRPCLGGRSAPNCPLRSAPRSGLQAPTPSPGASTPVMCVKDAPWRCALAGHGEPDSRSDFLDGGSVHITP